MEESFSMDGLGDGSGGDGGDGGDGERWGAMGSDGERQMKLRSLALLLTSCSAARFLTGCGPDRGLGTLVLTHETLKLR